jgi:diguanylate cyclase (GGDEF)-like protein
MLVAVNPQRATAVIDVPLRVVRPLGGGCIGMSQVRVADRGESVHEILVVDDEEVFRQHWKRILERADFRVRVASDGDEALEEIHRHPPDLVILDLIMERMNGDEVCRRLKQSQQTESIPVIMVTARGEFSDKIESLRYGANDYLVKVLDGALATLPDGAGVVDGDPDVDGEADASAANGGHATLAGIDTIQRLEEELVARVRNALRLRVDNRDGNPLTGLPGNARIERELAARIESGLPLAFLFIDIDHFKAFNDYYGYQRGDLAIKRTAELLTAAIWEYGGPGDFVGHVGGDDFVVMTTPERADVVAETIVEGFEHILEELFDEEEYRARAFTVEGRTGKVETFELMSLTIALITGENEPLVHPAQVNDRATELKNFGKKRRGSYIARDRRGAP